MKTKQTQQTKKPFIINITWLRSDNIKLSMNFFYITSNPEKAILQAVKKLPSHNFDPLQDQILTTDYETLSNGSLISTRTIK